MKFNIGDTVRLVVEKIYNDGTKIPSGTKGIIDKVYPMSESYLVSFDGFAKSRRIPESDLQ